MSIRAAFSAAKRVYLGEMTRAEAARQLNATHGINENSARDLIDGYKHLRRGEEFKRQLSAPHLNYYLGRISREEGEDALRTAVAAAWQHIAYYEEKRGVRLIALREVVARHHAASATAMLVDESEKQFRKAVARSLSESSAERRKRIKLAARKPARTVQVVIGYVRNPDVVAEVLFRACGKCESCKRTAPFTRRSDGSPYLEVHHVHRLADGGDDSVENAEALCPNCHREKHHGAVI